MQRSSWFGFLVFVFFFSLPSFAQNRGAYRTGTTSPLRPPQIGALGRPIPRAPNYYGRRGSYYGGGYGIASYPVLVGGYGADFYSPYGDYPGGQATQAPVPPAPPVVINQYFGDPSKQTAMGVANDPNVQVYSQPHPDTTAVPSSNPEPRSYLIALKDHSVVSALAYWVEDRTLHYVTPQNTHNQADLSLVDMDFTRKLNQDRNMTFTVAP